MVIQFLKNRKKLKSRLKEVRSQTLYYPNSKIFQVKKRFNKQSACIDKLVKYYRGFPKSNKPRPPDGIDTLTSRSRGAIGDAVNGAGFYAAAFVQGKKRFLQTTNNLNWIIKDFCPYFIDGVGKRGFETEKLGEINAGNGCSLQQFCRILSLVPPLIPSAGLVTGEKKIKNRIGICLTTGKSAFCKIGFNMPRQIYPKNLLQIQRLIWDNPQFEYIEFGKEKSGLYDVINYTGREIRDSIIELSKCEKLICLNSGFMHLGVGLGLDKVLVIINIPKSEDAFFPVLRTAWKDDAEWIPFSSKCVVLHQDYDNGVIPQFTYKNLSKALIDNDIYPYDNSPCYLIFEKEWEK